MPRKYPALFKDGAKPIENTRALAYGFGWIASKLELYSALNPDSYGTPQAARLLYLQDDIDDAIYLRWMEKGYRNELYNPPIPEARDVGDDYILVMMACNDSDEVMDSIMANKAYHQKCRDALNNPKTMMLEPAWFRAGLCRMPKGYLSE